jgi:hypothetical protein
MSRRGRALTGGAELLSRARTVGPLPQGRQWDWAESARWVRIGARGGYSGSSARGECLSPAWDSRAPGITGMGHHFPDAASEFRAFRTFLASASSAGFRFWRPPKLRWFQPLLWCSVNPQSKSAAHASPGLQPSGKRGVGRDRSSVRAWIGASDRSPASLCRGMNSEPGHECRGAAIGCARGIRRAPLQRLRAEWAWPASPLATAREGT